MSEGFAGHPGTIVKVLDLLAVQIQANSTNIKGQALLMGPKQRCDLSSKGLHSGKMGNTGKQSPSQPRKQTQLKRQTIKFTNKSGTFTA